MAYVLYVNGMAATVLKLNIATGGLLSNRGLANAGC